ncbi:hypothetical protein [Methanobrevibacter sp.]
MENEKYIIIGLIVAIALLAIGIGYFLFANSVEYQTIQISSGSTIEVPKADDVKWEIDANGIRIYSCPSKRVSVISFNSAENMTLVGAGAFAMAREALMADADMFEIYKSYEIKKNEINGTTFYLVNISSNETHDNIVIGCGDLDILKHMLDSLSLGAPKMVNATLTSSGSVSAPVKKNTTNSSAGKFTEEDMMDAYLSGYFDGSWDSYDYSSSYDSYDYGSGDVQYETTYDYGDSSQDSSDVETTTG